MDSRPPTSPLPASILLAAVLVASLGVETCWIMSDLDALVRRFLFEDAFYYFQTARNAAEGLGAASSGGIAHNGFHPLWLLACTAAFRSAPSDLAAIRAIMLLGAALCAAAAFLAYAILREIGCRRASALFAAVCFQLNPHMASLALSGMEAPMNAFLLALTTYWIVRRENRRSGHSYYVVLGILMGLVYLVRTDNVFFLAGAWLFLALRGRRRGATWVGLFGAGALALALAAPWFWWNLSRFGSLMQTSAGALPFVRRVAFFASRPDAGDWDFFAYRLGLLADFFPAALMYSGIGSVWYVLGAVVLGVLWTRRGREEIPRLAFALYLLTPLFVSALCLGIAHKFVRMATREWYYATTDLLLALVWGAAIHYTMQALRGRLARGAFLSAMAILVAAMFCVKGLGLDLTIGGKRIRISSPGLWTNERNVFALEIVEAIERLPDLAPGEPVGATDSGAIGFFSSHPVVNLDGVVNPEAAKAIRRGELMRYVERKGIRYLTVTPRMYNERIWCNGSREDLVRGLVPYPPLTSEGYRYESKENRRMTNEE